MLPLWKLPAAWPSKRSAKVVKPQPAESRSPFVSARPSSATGRAKLADREPQCQPGQVWQRSRGSHCIAQSWRSSAQPHYRPGAAAYTAIAGLILNLDEAITKPEPIAPSTSCSSTVDTSSVVWVSVRRSLRIVKRIVTADPTTAVGQAGLPGLPHFAATAKRVIYLFQSGAPSQHDLFDYKPQLAASFGK